MIRTLIVDDEPLARERIADLLAGVDDVEVVGTCDNGVAAVEFLAAHTVDLVFLDIQMPGLTGLEVVAQLESAAWPEIIFVTAYDQYALDAFAAHALDYLLKPFDNERFYAALEYARTRLAQAAGSSQQASLQAMIAQLPASTRYLQRIAVRQNECLRLVPVNEVECFNAEGVYVRLIGATTSHLVRDTLNHLETRLDPERFQRIHRSSIINLDALVELQHWHSGEWMAILRGGSRCVVSRSYRERLRQRFG